MNAEQSGRLVWPAAGEITRPHCLADRISKFGHKGLATPSWHVDVIARQRARFGAKVERRMRCIPCRRAAFSAAAGRAVPNRERRRQPAAK